MNGPVYSGHLSSQAKFPGPKVTGLEGFTVCWQVGSNVAVAGLLPSRKQVGSVEHQCTGTLCTSMYTEYQIIIVDEIDYVMPCLESGVTITTLCRVCFGLLCTLHICTYFVQFHSSQKLGTGLYTVQGIQSNLVNKYLKLLTN